MDLEFDGKAAGLTFGMWAIFLIGLWKVNIMGETPGWGFPQKMLMTVISLPIIYFIALWQLNR